MLAGVLYAVWGYLPQDSLETVVFVRSVLPIVVPLLFLLGLAGLRARCLGQAGWLGEVGFVLGFAALVWGGVVRLFLDKTPLYKYFVREGWPPWLSNWFAWLVISLIVVGLAIARTKALRGYGALSLTLGSFGWLFFSMGSGGVIETHLGRITFGALFCLGWMALGYTLWKHTRYSNERADMLDFRKQVGAMRSFVSFFVSRFR
jgi:hypothetical protein